MTPPLIKHCRICEKTLSCTVMRIGRRGKRAGGTTEMIDSNDGTLFCTNNLKGVWFCNDCYKEVWEAVEANLRGKKIE